MAIEEPAIQPQKLGNKLGVIVVAGIRGTCGTSLNDGKLEWVPGNGIPDTGPIEDELDIKYWRGQMRVRQLFGV